jgi:hypothetical protein
MKQNWFGFLVVLAAAFAAILFFPPGGEERDPSRPKKAETLDIKEALEAKGPRGNPQSKEENRRETSGQKPKKRAGVSSQFSGGIQVFSKVANPEQFLKLPDGNYVAPLNGVKEPAPFLWPPSIPFAPIIGKELDDHGRWWYVHKDGSKSTTFMGMHPQTGKLDARTDIMNPQTPLPLRKEESSK